MVKLSHNILNLNFICRINKVEATVEPMLSIAPSRNRVVYPCPFRQAGISGAFFGYLFGQAKRYKTELMNNLKTKIN